MNGDYRNIDELLRRRLPSASRDRMEWNAARVLHRLRSEEEWHQDRADVSTAAALAPSGPLKWHRFALVSAAASMLLLVLIVAPRNDAFAVVENLGGDLSVVHDGYKRTLRGGEHVAANERIRSGGGAASAIRLADGSRIEMRSDSQLSVQNGADGPRILLNEGDIIVSTSKERAGDLYVQTRDVTVAVRGTTFLVNAEEDGSRVAVIEGEARVQQGPALKKLLPGEQIATGLSAQPVSVAQQISWSRYATGHRAVLERLSETLKRTEASFTSAPRAGQTPSFEVASIRRNNDPTCRQFLCGITTQPRSGRLIIQNQNLLSIIKTAYGVRPEIILGGPDWRNKDKFDIEAKAERPVDNEAALFLMLRSLLAQRFQLVLRREMREMPLYTLGVSKNSSKLQKAQEDGSTLSPGGLAGGGGGRGRCAATGITNIGSLQRLGDAVAYAAGIRQFAGRASMPQLANFLSMFVGCRPVLDKTDLPGVFDLRVEWTSSPPELFLPGDPDPAMISALVDQVGIKLQTEKALGEVLVIDSVQPPTEN